MAPLPEKPQTQEKMVIKINDGIVFLGARGSGKTSAMKYFIQEILKNYTFTILDVIGNFADMKDQSNVKYFEVNPRDERRVEEIIKSIFEAGTKQMLIVDEIDRYNLLKKNALSDYINLGRNYGFGFMCAARRTADTSKDVLANSTWAIIFRHILPQDLKVLTDWFALDEGVFRDLQDHEVIVFRNGQQVWQGLFPFDEKANTSDQITTRSPTDEIGGEKTSDKEEALNNTSKENGRTTTDEMRCPECDGLQFDDTDDLLDHDKNVHQVVQRYKPPKLGLPKPQ